MASKADFKTGSGLEAIAKKLKASEDERKKFASDPLKYLTDNGVQIPKEFERAIQDQGAHIEELHSGARTGKDRCLAVA